MTRILERYDEELMGLPYPITLLDAAEEIADPNTGEVLGVAVPNSEELAAAVALALCFMPTRLLGAEVRFIRRVLGMTGQELAAAVEMDPATLSRWEHGKQDVGGWADKAVRMAAVLQLQDHAPGSSLRPEDVVMLRLEPRQSDAHPKIEVHRVRSDNSVIETETKGWDAVATLPEAA
jgi:transcriptional regulator with XRE-family HTH domain